MLVRLESVSARVIAGVGAVLLVVSGYVHLHLWDIAYRHVDTLGPLFLVQAAAAVVLAVLMIAWPTRLVLVAAAVFSAGTIAGFVKAINGGIFGFTLPVITSWAKLALGAEIGVIFLAAAALLVDLSGAPGESGAPRANRSAANPSGA
jgi:hypothetical protein